jgi:N-acetylglucosaminyldiphosphoundecaprenol N-acetyl-beta-D-mannosaminyltransferase
VESVSLRANVLGIGVDAANMGTVIAAIKGALEKREKGYVCLGGVHGIMEAHKDSALRSVFANALMVAPDGMPTVWVGQMQGFAGMERVFGPDLMIEAMSSAELKGCTHFLCGGDYGVAEELRDKLRARLPHVRIVGGYTPPFRALTEAEEAQMIEIIAQVKPDIVWVGLGTPKQDLFMSKYLPLLETTVMIGVGAAFLYHTGRLRDSPNWVKRAGLQWADRLIQEPGRLWKRYLFANPKFLACMVLQLAGIKRYSMMEPFRDK